LAFIADFFNNSNMVFDLKKTAIFQAIKLEKNPIFYLRNFWKILFLILTLVSFSSIILDLPYFKTNVFVLFLILFIFFAEFNFFFDSRLKNPRLKRRAFKCKLSEAALNPEKFNLASFLDYEAASLIYQSLTKKPTVHTQQNLFYTLLVSKNKEINFIFNRALLDIFRLRNKELKKIQKKETFDLNQLILNSLKIANQRNKEKIGIGDILIALAEIDSFFKKLLIEKNLKKEDIENLAFWFERINEKIEKRKRFWEYENLVKKGSIGRDWASGYTLTLDKFSIDLREQIIKKIGIRQFTGHQPQINQLERILQREELNNALLIGRPGSGRKAVIDELVQKAYLGQSTSKINYKRFLELDISFLVSQIGSIEEIEEVLEMCFKEAVQAGNIILIINNFENFMIEEIKPGKIDISGILARYLELASFQLIATSAYEGLHTIIERKPAILNLFEKVEISEISEKETLEFLENFVPFFEQKYKKFISYQALREIINLASRYLANFPFPKKAFDILDEVMVYTAQRKKSYLVLPEHIQHIVSQKTQIPIGEVESKEKEILLNLENLIHQRIINQEEAVSEIAMALRRARAEIELSKKPMGVFLFLGPTGVGKTETAKALAQIYFGKEEKMIRLDMSEFQRIEDIKRLIGEGKIEGLLTTPVRENPFSLILFDEIEKAHKDILNLFLQVFDEGHLTDGQGQKIDFRNTIIIGTSNAGSEIIRRDIEKNKQLDILKEELLDYLFKENIFRPEFINRFDAVIVFKPLTKENFLAICQLLLSKLKTNLSDKGIEFEITPELKEKIVELSYSPVFGARETRRVIQNKLGDTLATAILSGKLKRGDKIKVTPTKFEIIKLER